MSQEVYHPIRYPIIALLMIAAGWCALNACAGSQNLPPKPGGDVTDLYRHPLDPLSAEEIKATVDILRAAGKLSSGRRFASVMLKEPAKQEVLRFTSGAPIRRTAAVVLYDREQNATFETDVDLTAGMLKSWREVPGVQPGLLLEEYGQLGRIVRADPAFQGAMRKRNITDLNNVNIDGWAPGYFGSPAELSTRRMRAVFYYRRESNNEYGRPIEGLSAVVDLNARKLVELIDTGVVPISSDPAPLQSGTPAVPHRDAAREAPAAPQSFPFEVRGSEVIWKRWRFRFAPDSREGVVLHTVQLTDGTMVRPVMYRASVAETVVPYGDPAPTWYFRNAFDEGEYGLGKLSGSLQPSVDCPPDTRFFDATYAGELGTPFRVPRAVGLYERDGGLLWRRGRIGRRARQLVLTFVATIGNYDYVFNWVFHEDGVLEQELLLTGVMTSKGVARHSDLGHQMKEEHGHLVAANIEAPHHQHFFNFRLDLDVDGSEPNSVVEMNAQPSQRGPANPQGNAFSMKLTRFKTERQAVRMLNLPTSRRWTIINTAHRNALGQYVGYTLLPGDNAVAFADPSSWVRKRARFLDAPLWVTPFSPTERFPAGEYVNQSRGEDGMSKWTQKDRSIDGRDVVLWYTVGVTHTPRPEEWPVMPAYRTGFKLLPTSFFHRTPGFDAAPAG